tara:strand:- start:2949 stop:3665 length:717 start_codon:yes stop_codon:yes gene_type:complete
MEKIIKKINKNISDLKTAIDFLNRQNIGASNKFVEAQKEYYMKRMFNLTNKIDDLNLMLKKQLKQDQNLIGLIELLTDISKIKDKTDIIMKANKAQRLIRSINLSVEGIFIKPNNIPDAVQHEILEDIDELNRCYSSVCYRSAIILCGRILETCLFRKYYELTKKDLLATSPNIGLGKLIAKLTEQSVRFDPGLTQQIHLINNIRIQSVHKKKDLFLPSQQQTRAVVLFTMDVIKKLF